MTQVEIPHQNEMLWATLQAVAQLGGSASIGEIVETVIKIEGFSDAQQEVLHNAGPTTEIGYRLGWVRTYLRGMGLLTNSARGVWALTDEGAAVLESAPTDTEGRERLRVTLAAYLAQFQPKGKTKDDQTATDPVSFDQPGVEGDWKEQLLGHLMSMKPDAFERLAQRLLREADVDSVSVTGKSGDGGIDGKGVYRLGLVSFPVFFQCKRYQGSVGSSVVRDFRGAMAGRGDKGLLITTGTFTPEAKKEAARDGVPPIDLIDGDRLCDLLKQYELGVHTVTRTVEDTTVDGAFFSDL